jgi:hypothetical protein
VKVTTEVTIETDEVWVIRSSASRGAVWCTECGDQVPLLTPAETTDFAHMSAAAICGLAERGTIHYTRTPEGALLVCIRSVMRYLTRTR